MEGREIRGLMEAYSQVYETPEVLNEEVVEEDVEQLMERGAPTDPKARAAYDAQVAKNRSALGNTLLYGNAEGRKPSTLSQPTNRRGGGTVASANKPAAAPAKPKVSNIPPAEGTKPAAAGAPVKPAATASTAAKPTASGVVLAKQGGVEGKLDKATGKFTAGAFDDKDKARYNQRAPKTGPATGMLGKTSYEVRTPTSAELKAAQAARAAGEKNPEKVLQAAQSAGKAATTPPKPSNSVGFNAPPAGSPPPSAAYTAAKPAATPKPAAAPAKPAPVPTPGKETPEMKKVGNALSANPLPKPADAPAKPPAPAPAAAGGIRRPAPIVTGVGPNAGPNPTGDRPRLDLSKNRALNQSLDLFDLVKGHLLDEGYADSEEGAMVIMVNMSEEWRKSILESHGVELDEAQRARENPEEYERSESRRQSKRERAMNDPHTGINSPAFAEFMRQQMGGKKKKS